MRVTRSPEGGIGRGNTVEYVSSAHGLECSWWVLARARDDIIIIAADAITRSWC